MARKTLALAHHFVARMRWPHAHLREPEHARWLWRRLQHAFPDALGVALMPNHIHLVLVCRDERAIRRRLAAILATLSRRVGLGPLWTPLPAGEALIDADKLRRTLRYLALNPCRPSKLDGATVQLVADPLAWLWSTHRDAIGAVARPWVTADRLRAALGRGGPDFRARWHAYVSADPSVTVTGTTLPTPAAPHAVPVVPLAAVARAAADAHRASPSAIQRRGPVRETFLALALHQGWTSSRDLSIGAGTEERAVQRFRRRAHEVPLDAARMCLADPRLHSTSGPLRVFRTLEAGRSNGAQAGVRVLDARLEGPTPRSPAFGAAVSAATEPPLRED